MTHQVKMKTSEAVESYDKQRQGISEALKDAAAQSKSKAAKRASAAFEKPEDFHEVARSIFHESLDMYDQGEMDWEDIVDDLAKALKAIDMMEPPESSKD